MNILLNLTQPYFLFGNYYSFAPKKLYYIFNFLFYSCLFLLVSLAMLPGLFCNFFSFQKIAYEVLGFSFLARSCQNSFWTETRLSLLSFNSHRRVNSQSNMALPLRTNLKHFICFIQRFRPLKRCFCAAVCPEIKVRAVERFRSRLWEKYFLACFSFNLENIGAVGSRSSCLSLL